MKSIKSNYEKDNKKTTAKRVNTRRNFITNMNNKEKKARGWKKGHEVYYDNGIKLTYNGKRYESVAELCRELGVKLSSFRSYLSFRYKGVSTKKKQKLIQENIQADTDRYLKKHSKYTAPDGTVYDSFSDCCRNNGVNYGAAYNRIKRNRCPEEQVFNKKRLGIVTKDHLGNTFESKEKMCKHYGITIATFNRRQNKGWTLERILTEPSTPHIKGFKAVYLFTIKNEHLFGTTCLLCGEQKIMNKDEMKEHREVCFRKRYGDFIQ